MSSQDRQHALATADVKVHASTIRKRHTSFMGGNLCSPRNMKARLKFDRENVNKDQDFWNNVLWTVESTTELFGHQNRGQVCHKPNTAVQENNLTPTVQRGGGEVRVWGCFAAAAPAQLTITESTMNSTVNQRVQEKQERLSLQQDNKPKHTSQSTRNWLKTSKWSPGKAESKPRCCGSTWNGLYMQEPPQTSHSCKNSALRIWTNFPWTDVRRIQEISLKLFQPQWETPAVREVRCPNFCLS